MNQLNKCKTTRDAQYIHAILITGISLELFCIKYGMFNCACTFDYLCYHLGSLINVIILKIQNITFFIHYNDVMRKLTCNT